MKIETVARDDQQIKLIAEVDPEMLEKYKHQAARKISQSQKIPGFRPGKAPFDMIRRIVGDEALQQEAIEMMLDEVYPQAIREANINPSGSGKLEEITSVNPPTFAFIVPLQPEIQLGDYKSIQKEYAPESVTEEQVESTLRRLQRSYATAEPVEREAQKGDMVSFTLSAKRINPEEGENETLIEETPYQMIAGEMDEDDESGTWPYEGFTDELLGVKAEDVKTVPHTFDEESPYEDLHGKEVEFKLTIQSVKELHLPELDAEFAQTLGEFETVEDLRNGIHTQLTQNYAQQYNQNYFDELVDELVDQATIKYPPHMLEEEIHQFMHGLEHNLEHDHLDLETYLKMRNLEQDAFIEQEVQPAAERRLKRSLALEEFARQEGIQVKDEEVQSIYFSAMQQFQSKEMRKLQAQSKNRQTPQELASSYAIDTVNNIFNQRLMARLKALASGETETADIADIMDATPAASEVIDATVTDTVVTESVEEAAPVAEETSAVSDAPQAETPVVEENDEKSED